LSSGRRADPLLLWEAGLALLLLVLFILLFLLPAARQPFRPHWFAGPLLAAGLFGLLVLDRRRKGRRDREKLRDVLEEAESGSIREGGEEDHPG
jgi:hypothetical protein